MVMYAYEVETKQEEKLPDIKKKTSPYMFWYSGTKHWIHDLWEQIGLTGWNYSERIIIWRSVSIPSDQYY